MKRKKNIYRALIPVVSLFSVFLFTGCDKIDGTYLTPFKQGDWNGRRVLLEDYTGHKCPNCPTAAKIAKDLKELYGEKLIVVSIHAGYFAWPVTSSDTTFKADYQTQAGTDYDNFFGISLVGNPNGMVNRTGWQGSHIFSPDSWTSEISSEINKSPELEVEIENNYTPANRKVDIKVETSFLRSLQRNMKLLVWIIEDHIISPQQNSDPNVGPVGIIMDYEHQHVLRTSVNSTWGTQISSSSSIVPNGTVLTNTFSYILPQEWKDYDCNVVAFVYDDQTKEVYQINEAKVKQ